MKLCDTIPHDLNVWIPPNDGIELEPGPDGQGEAQHWLNVHIELVE